MMSISHLLEDFNPVALTPADITDGQEEALEIEKLAAFEQGYSAGWDDASAAHASDQTKATAELARSLSDISFTYHEALGQVNTSLAPMFDAIAGQLIPALQQPALRAHVSDLLHRTAVEGLHPPIEVNCSATDFTALENILPQIDAIPVKIKRQDTLPAGQVFVSIGDDERVIDIAGLVATISENLEALAYHTREERRHG